MKKIATLLILLICTFVTSCSDDDSTNPVNGCNELMFPAQYHGTWKLINVSGGIAGVSHDFNPGVIKWTFAPCQSSVTVVNNNDNELVEDFLETGTYTSGFTEFDADAPGCPQYFIVGNTDFGCISYPEQGVMTLTQQVADGYTLKFTR